MSIVQHMFSPKAIVLIVNERLTSNSSAPSKYYLENRPSQFTYLAHGCQGSTLTENSATCNFWGVLGKCFVLKRRTLKIQWQLAISWPVKFNILSGQFSGVHFKMKVCRGQNRILRKKLFILKKKLKEFHWEMAILWTLKVAPSWKINNVWFTFFVYHPPLGQQSDVPTLGHHICCPRGGW